MNVSILSLINLVSRIVSGVAPVDAGSRPVACTTFLLQGITADVTVNITIPYVV